MNPLMELAAEKLLVKLEIAGAVGAGLGLGLAHLRRKK